MVKRPTNPVRSATMRAVKGKNTTPELVVRRLTHSLGYRYRLHQSDLPGRPDLVFSARRKAIFVEGCFWHGHGCRRGARIPKENRDYWTAKIARNKARDVQNRERLRELGWAVLTVWECEMKDRTILSDRLVAFLGPPKST